MDAYNPLTLEYGAIPQITSIIILTIVIGAFCLIYFLQVRKLKPDDTPKRFTLIMDAFIAACRSLVVESLGVKFVKLTPYFIFLLSYLCLGNIAMVFGFKEPATASTVPMTLGLIMFIGTFVVAIKYQKLSFVNQFLIRVTIMDHKIPVMINPLEIIGKFTPLLSITFRLWGNVMSGSIIFAVIFWALGSVSNMFPAIGVIIVAGTFLLPALMIYFSLFAGLIQAFVFTLLTVSYWGLEYQHGLEYEEERKLAKEKKLAKLELKKEKKLNNNVHLANN